MKKEIKTEEKIAKIIYILYIDIKNKVDLYKYNLKMEIIQIYYIETHHTYNFTYQ